MAQFIKASGSLNLTEKPKKMVEVFKFGQTDPDMMDSGVMAWPMDMDV